MKRRYFIVCCLILSVTALLSGCAIRENKTVTTTCEVEPGMTLHIDTKVRSGAVSIMVTDSNGVLYYKDVLENDFNCEINVYIAKRYTIIAKWQNACGTVNIYHEKKQK